MDPIHFQDGDPFTFNRYAYASNNPYKFVDPDGRVSDTILNVGFIGYSVYTLFKEPSWVNAAALGGDIVGAAVPFVTGVGTGIRATAHADDAIDAVRGASKAGEAAKSATSSRVKLRKGTRERIDANQPRNAAGQPVDPHSGDPLKPGEIDIGHKKGQAWRDRKRMHEEWGSTRQEVIEAENNADLYHLEDRSGNRSHRNE